MKYILIIMVLLYGTALYGQSVQTEMPPRSINWEDVIDFTYSTSNAADTITFPNTYRLYHVVLGTSESGAYLIGGSDIVGDTADYVVQYQYTDQYGRVNGTWSTFSAGTGTSYVPGTAAATSVSDYIHKGLFVKFRLIIGKGTTQSVSNARIRIYRLVIR